MKKMLLAAVGVATDLSAFQVGSSGQQRDSLSVAAVFLFRRWL